MLDDLFLPEKQADKYLRAADQRGGAYSILTGDRRQPFVHAPARRWRSPTWCRDLALPDYPAMPSHTEPVPMPPKPDGNS